MGSDDLDLTPCETGNCPPTSCETGNCPPTPCETGNCPPTPCETGNCPPTPCATGNCPPTPCEMGNCPPTDEPICIPCSSGICDKFFKMHPKLPTIDYNSPDFASHPYFHGEVYNRQFLYCYFPEDELFNIGYFNF